MRGIVVAVLLLVGCGSDDKATPAPAPVAEASISEEDALRVAQKDALEAYKKLEHYEVRSELKPDGWHIDYLLPENTASYVIDAKSGEILSKGYR